MMMFRLFALLAAATMATATSLLLEDKMYDRSCNERQVGDGPGKYPWWNGVELANPAARVRIDGFIAFSCRDCKETWSTHINPLLDKYGKRISFVLHPLALPYQPYSYDMTRAAYAVYRLSSNNTDTFKRYLSLMFENQRVVFEALDMTQRQVYETYFAAWAERVGIPAKEFMRAMLGQTTTANFDALYSARYARQRTLLGAPTYLLNSWLSHDLPVNSWSFADWCKWLDANLEE